MPSSVSAAPSTTQGPSWNELPAARVLTGLALAAIVAYAAALRLHELDESYWIDEVLTHERAGETVATILSKPDPVTVLIAHYMRGFSGEEFVVRLPFALAGAAGVLAMYFLARSGGGPLAGLICAALLAASPFHLEISQNARYYGILVLAYIAGAWVLSRALRLNQLLDWVVLALIGLIGIETHLTMVFFLGPAAVGGAIWAAFARGLPASEKFSRVLLLALCVAVPFLPSLGEHIERFKGFAGLVEQPARPVEGEMAADVPIAAAIEEKLGPEDYVGYVRDFFQGFARWQEYALLGLAGLGLISLFVNNRALGCIMLALLAAPVPLFYLSLGHAPSSRHFSILLPVGILLGGLGLAWVTAGGRRAALWASNDGRGLGLAAGGLCTALLLTGFGLIYAPRTNAAVADYFRERPQEDWKGLAKYLAPQVQEGDAFIYWPHEHRPGAGPRYWSAVMAAPMEFYLNRELPGPQLTMNRIKRYGVKHASEIVPIVKADPSSTTWVITRWEEQLAPEEQETLRKIAGPGTRFQGLTIHPLGAPTVNLIAQGAFEVGGVSESPSGEVALSRSTPNPAGGRSLRLSNLGNAKVGATMPVAPVVYWVRNSFLDAWDNGKPLGWELPGDAEVGRLARATEGTHGAGTSLRVLPGDSTVRIEQVLAAPPTDAGPIQLTVVAKSTGAFRAALSYVDGIGQIHEEWIKYSGGGQWEDLLGETDLGGRHPGSPIKVVIESPADADSYIDAVAVTRSANATTLDPGFDYVLSLYLKHEYVEAAKNDPTLTAEVALMGTQSDGGERRQRLISFDGKRDWSRYVFHLKPGVDTAADIHDLRVFVGFSGGIGVLWIDDVQLEAGPIATPPTRGIRLPHDEQLAAVGN